MKLHTLHIEFPMPDEADRLRIWERVFPEGAPLDGVDVSFMARQFKISGGSIKNIAVGAAFLAAKDGGPITMDRLIGATKREYQKMGRLMVESEFRGYYHLVK